MSFLRHWCFMYNIIDVDTWHHTPVKRIEPGRVNGSVAESSPSAVKSDSGWSCLQMCCTKEITPDSRNCAAQDSLF